MRRLSPIRVYVDTSVFGGIFDPEFERASQRFFDKLDSGVFEPVVSLVVAQEMADAPDRVRKAYQEVVGAIPVVQIDAAALDLRDAYLKAGIVNKRWAADALHVAIATVSGCSMIVSWNFKHIVNFRRIPLYNAVNRANGFGEIGIFTPQEVIEDEEETV